MTLKEEGAGLLSATDIERVLTWYGEVSIGGSYSYDLLVDRDIDLDVRLPVGVELDFDKRSEIAAALLKIRQVRSIKMADIYHFPEGAKHAIQGIWYGLGVVVPSSGARWNIDIWCIPHGGATEADSDMVMRLKNLSEIERQAIMTIKQRCLDEGLKQKNRTSMQVYQAVLEQGVTSFEQYVGLYKNDNS